MTPHTLALEACCWQPMETAPKDGSLVLLWVPDLEQPVVGFYGWPAWNYWTGECVWLEVTDDDWGVLDSRLPGKRGAPTHWMPLPPPPPTPDPTTLNIGGGER